MEEFIPATGRVLRYWCDAVAVRARQQLYDYLGVRPIPNPADEAEASVSWAASEVWSQPEPGHEQTVTLTAGQMDSTIPRLNKRVRIAPLKFSKPAQRRPGAVLSATFDCTRARQRRAGRGSTGMGLF